MAFHQDLHCLQKQKPSSKNTNLFGNYDCDPSIYRNEHPICILYQISRKNPLVRKGLIPIGPHVASFKS